MEGVLRMAGLEQIAIRIVVVEDLGQPGRTRAAAAGKQERGCGAARNVQIERAAQPTAHPAP
jgi:hypothetical protein